MTPEMEKYLYNRLAERADKLSKISKLTTPVNAITTLFAINVINTCILLLGEEFLKSILSEIFDNTAEAHGICKFCHTEVLLRDRGMCQKCWDQIEEDDKKYII